MLAEALAKHVGVPHAVLEARDDRARRQHFGERGAHLRGLRALHAAEHDVAVSETRRVGDDLDPILRDDTTGVAVEIREDKTRRFELLLRAFAADEDDVRALCGEAATDITANRTGPHHADA